jgi:8-hydroxy-5-deazaflavin:NADPH oxidoreductase
MTSFNTYLMVPGRIWYKNSIAGTQTLDEHIRNLAPSTASFGGTDDTTVNDDGAGTASCLALESRHAMSSISLIGLGGMARALGARAVEGGNAVEVTGRDQAKAKNLAAALGGGATTGTFGTAPAGDIVILAVPYASAAQVLDQYGDALAGKVIIDISNTFNADATALVTPDGTSGAQEIAKAAPASAHVVKAFNTVFGHILAQGGPLDVLIAADDADAKASVSAFIESLGLRPLDVGGLAMAHWLEGTGLLMMGLAGHGAGFNIALGVDVVSNVNDVPELSTEKITQVVRSYIELAGHGSAAGHRSADEVAALFADNAIFESPTGGDVHRGIEAIRSAYHSMWDGREQEVDLVSLNVAGGEAAVHVQVILPGQRVDVIDVMTFDKDAKILSLRTY